MSAAQHNSSKRISSKIIIIIIAAIVVALIAAGIAFGISRSQSAQTSSSSTAASEQQSKEPDDTDSDDTVTDSAKKQNTAESNTQSNEEKAKQSNNEETSQPNNAAQQEQTAPADIPAALQQTDAACNPHTSFNAENPAQESLIVDQATQSLTLMSGSQSTFATYDCVAKQLQIPADVTAEIESKQDQPMQKSFTWNGLTGTWSYNVNSGLQLYIVEQ